MTTDLTWLRDPRVRKSGFGIGFDGGLVIDAIIWSPEPGVVPVRLTVQQGHTGSLLVNGQYEEDRHDITALFDALDQIDQADLPPGEVAAWPAEAWGFE